MMFIVIGGGLAGLVAATEATARGKRVCLVDQEGPQKLGGQAFWSLGGLFFVDSSEQRRMRIRDSLDLARQELDGLCRLRPVGRPLAAPMGGSLSAICRR